MLVSFVRCLCWRWDFPFILQQFLRRQDAVRISLIRSITAVIGHIIVRNLEISKSEVIKLNIVKASLHGEEDALNALLL